MPPLRIGLAVLSLAAALATAEPAAAQQLPFPFRPISSAADPVAAFVTEASQQFGVPESWIRAVMRVESAGNAAATSPAGAIGLMQVMPQTYAALRVRLGLGADAYDPHDNIMAGAAYLREMRDQYGSAGFLAAYNAGPSRWEDYLAGVRSLPPETIRYMARLAPMLGSDGATMLSPGLSRAVVAPETAPIFVALGGPNQQMIGPAAGQIVAADAPAEPSTGGLFMVRRMLPAEPSGSKPGRDSHASMPAPPRPQSPARASPAGPLNPLFVPRMPPQGQL